MIFTTAHNQYAITAFELGALDYVLKPFGPERLERVQTREERGERADGPASRSGKEALQPARRPLSRISCPRRQAGSRSRSQASGARTGRRRLRDDRHATKEFLVSIRLADLESRSRAKFLRIHRSHLINLEFVV